MASRIAVLAVLEPVHGHLSVAEIDQRLRECLPAKDQPPDLATIYRTVTALVDQGVLHALTLEGGVTTFGLAAKPPTTRCAHDAAPSSKCPRDDWPPHWNMRWQAVRSPCPARRPHPARTVPAVPGGRRPGRIAAKLMATEQRALAG